MTVFFRIHRQESLLMVERLLSPQPHWKIATTMRMMRGCRKRGSSPQR